MDISSSMNSSSGLQQNFGPLPDSTFPDSQGFFHQVDHHRTSSLFSVPEIQVLAQNRAPGHTSLRGDRPSTTLDGLTENTIIGRFARRANALLEDDRTQSGSSHDVLNRRAGYDRLIGCRGKDLLVGGSGYNQCLGRRGNDGLKGHSRGDRFRAGRGNDDLNAGTGIVHLCGGPGKDILMDYEGGERLIGSSGIDQFGVGSPLTTKATIITNFKVGTDQVKSLRLGATFEDFTLKKHRGGTLVKDKDQEVAWLQGVNVKHLTSNNFVFGDTQLAEILQDNLEQSLDINPQATGLSSAVFAPDGTLWIGYAGVVDRDRQTPINSDSLFGIGSITKPIVATTVLQLQEEGQLSLNDTLSQWLPEIGNKIQNGEQITIRQLLGHTSGIPDYSTDPDFIELFYSNPSSPSQQYTSAELLPYIERRTLSEPGQVYSYSNSNYVLLGEIIEKMTGTTLASQLRQRIFEPLGMNHTIFAPQESIQKGILTQSYADFNGDGQLDALNENVSWAGAAGGVISTAVDIAKFSQALFQGELLAPATLKQMINDSSELDLFSVLEHRRYGLGVESGSLPDVGEFWGHDGATIGWQSGMAYLPNRQTSAVVLASAADDFSESLAITLVLQNVQNIAQRYPMASKD